MPTRLCLDCRRAPATYRGRCVNCSRTNERHTHPPDRKRIYNSKRWQLLRRQVLFEQPICTACDEAIATDVDHIVAIEDGGDPWARANLSPMCHACHAAKTSREVRTR